MKKIVMLCSILCLGMGNFVHSQIVPAVLTTTQPIKVSPDSAAQKHKANTETGKHPQHRKMIVAADTLTMSDYMMSIDRVNDRLNAISDSAKLGFEIVGMSRRLDAMTNDIALIRQNIRGRSSGINMKNLYLYQSFASDLDKENDLIQARITKLYNSVYHAKLHLKSALLDSVFRVMYADSTLRNALDKKLVRLEKKWVRADSLTKAGVNSLNALKVKVSDNSITLSNMLNRLDDRLDKIGLQLFGQETNCLWQKALPDTLSKKGSKQIVSALGSEQKAVGYYISQTSQQRYIIVVLAFLLFLWLFLKRRQLNAFRKSDQSFSFLHLQYLNTHPVWSLIVVLLSLMPFFDAYAPTTYITYEYLLLLSAVSVMMYKKWNHSEWISWMILVVLFVAMAVTNLFSESTLTLRVWSLMLHGGIAVFAIRFIKKMNADTPFYKWIKIAIIVGIIFACLGILSNILGRFSLSGIFGVTAIFAITQAITLPICVDTVIEIILLQLQSSRLKKGTNRPFDCTIIINKIRLPLLIIVALLWLIMLTSNLNLYHNISNSITDLLTQTHTIGSISFKLASVLLFFVIIWIAHILQRLITFLFGETGNEIEDTSVSKGQHSRLLITRLLVLIGGYLLAIAASGLPIDKLTFILGALGVGIGMGLQNIVNNFVSGIILIFDGSLQIGDVIEVSGQSGKVKEIGLRASTLNTADGAEVIIPNGTILSQNIVNWTYSNDQRRVMIEFSLSGDELDANVISTIINLTIEKIPNVITQKRPVILFTKVQQQTCRLTVRFWSTITNVDQVKSDAMQQLSTGFMAKGIMME